jgi:hypothetical protein
MDVKVAKNTIISSGNSVTINGKTYKGGKSVSVVNGVVIVDGKRVNEVEEGNRVVLQISGSIEKFLCDGDLEVEGDINAEEVVSGQSISCSNIKGSVFSKGSVTSSDIDGRVEAGGSVNCANIGGDVQAGGSVNAAVIKGRVK